MFVPTLRNVASSRRAFAGLLALIAAIAVLFAARSIARDTLAERDSEPAVIRSETPAWAQPEYSPDRGWHRKPVAVDHMLRSDRRDERR